MGLRQEMPDGDVAFVGGVLSLAAYLTLSHGLRHAARSLLDFLGDLLRILH